ncbi:phosphoribosylformylglycinamidine synthase subunit PurS [Microaerobacter geothermalis]|uniref:phosphoribosylformylglycinamidine synthase subunit PurS n=1 Tax=Microaerobacter geothermalis TaxID=674972 RepID=UPI001F24B492|nr:phosphoribosylformylglycinamidine synthase subunit PurS [Microaerobacter geothermalis]MCF6094489.1 phosphoribosylformylglycinamidine synthase subunit PurS [Microaerobacter geothermalis]
MYKAMIYITLKQSVLDPQGNAVKHALFSLGFDEVDEVRIGKYMEVTLEAESRKMAEERVKEMCEKLLANTVIEDYRFDLMEG